MAIDDYIFNEDGTLSEQRIRKCELAFFYGRYPSSFRQELENICIIPNGKFYYSNTEVKKIFNYLGTLTRADVEKALPKITEYYKKLRLKYKKEHLI